MTSTRGKFTAFSWGTPSSPIQVHGEVSICATPVVKVLLPQKCWSGFLGLEVYPPAQHQGARKLMWDVSGLGACSLGKARAGLQDQQWSDFHGKASGCPPAPGTQIHKNGDCGAAGRQPLPPTVHGAAMGKAKGCPAEGGLLGE